MVQIIVHRLYNFLYHHYSLFFESIKIVTGPSFTMVTFISAPNFPVCIFLTKSLSSCFEGAQIEPTAYENRYALHFVCADTDENRIKLEVYHKWHPFADNAKILYMAPVFFGEGNGGELCDGRFENPIEAFEAGYLYGKEQANVSIDA